MPIYLFSSFSILPLLLLIFLFSFLSLPSLSSFQVLSIVAVYSIGLIPQRKMLQLLFTFVVMLIMMISIPLPFPSLSLFLFAPPPPLHTSQVVLLINAAVQFGNVLLLSSYLMFMLLSSLVRFHCTCNDNNNNYY